MQPLNEVWQKIWPRIRPAAGVAGYLDWTTGLLVLDCSPSEWSALKACISTQSLSGASAYTLTPELGRIFRTWVHEIYHYFQVSICGFPYLMACAAHANQKLLLEPFAPFSGVEELLHATETMRPHLQERTAPISSFMADQGAKGISPLGLLESSAVLAEWKYHTRGQSQPAHYMAFLDNSGLPLIYREAFDATVRGMRGDIERACALHLLFCMLALCCGEPGDAFFRFIRQAMHMDIKALPAAKHLTVMISELLRAIPEGAVLGSAAEFISLDTDLPRNHPQFTPAVFALNQSAGSTPPFDLLVRPEAWPPRIIDHLPATFMRDCGVFVPPWMTAKHGRGRTENDLAAQVLLAAALRGEQVETIFSLPCTANPGLGVTKSDTQPNEATLVIQERILDTLEFGEGNIFVIETPSRRTPLVPFIKELHKDLREVRVIDLDAADPGEAHVALFNAGDSGAVVVWMAETRFPAKLAHVAYVWLKGDGLVEPKTGLTLDPRGKRRPVLILLLGRGAWEALSRPMRSQLTEIVSGGGHWYPAGRVVRKPLATL